MRSLAVAFVWLELFGWPASSASQVVQSIVNAPFTATYRHSSAAETDSTSGDYEEWARSSDSSFFQARYSPGAAKDQKIDGPLFINIRNVSLGCGVVVDQQGGGQVSFSLASISPSHTVTLEESRANLQRRQMAFASKPDISRPDASFHRVALGEQTVNGATLYGVRTDVARSGVSYTTERWEADLGFVYRETSTRDPAGTSTYFVTGLRRDEPDPELFVVPKAYLPHTDEFLSARTIFVQRSRDHKDVEDRVLAILQQSGRFTVVDQKEKSDLTLEFETGTANPNTSQAENYVLLNFGVSGQFFHISLSSPARTESWIDDHVIDSCLSNLWSRMESTRR